VDSFDEFNNHSSVSTIVGAKGIERLLEIAGNCEFKFKPVDSETSAILGRTLAWAAIGAGASYLATCSAPLPLEVRAGCAVAGALMGGGLGYFTATHQIKIVHINPGHSSPMFNVVIDPL
jgi:hypothetical protein